MSPEDRVALILGRAIMRAEALQAANEELHAQIGRLKSEREPADQPQPEKED